MNVRELIERQQSVVDQLAKEEREAIKDGRPVAAMELEHAFTDATEVLDGLKEHARATMGF